MNKFLSHFGAGILGAAVMLLFFWATGRLSKPEAPEPVVIIEEKVRIIDTCFTETVTTIEEGTHTVPGKVKKEEKIKPDTMWRIALDTITITCPRRTEYFTFSHESDLLEISEMVAVKGCDLELIDFHRSIKMDTLKKVIKEERLNTVLLEPTEKIVPFRFNRVKLGFDMVSPDFNQAFYGPTLGFEFHNGVAFRGTKFLNSKGGAIGAEIALFRFGKKYE